MAHKIMYEAINGTLQDILNNTLIVGGIPLLLCSDFRQLLPVCERWHEGANCESQY